MNYWSFPDLLIRHTLRYWRLMNFVLSFLKTTLIRIQIMILRVRINWSYHWYKQSTQRSSRMLAKVLELENELDFQYRRLR